MHTFFLAIESEQPFYILDLTDSHHLSKVLRAKKGDKIQILDGQGGLYVAEIIDLDAKGTRIQLQQKIRQAPPRSYSIRLAILSRSYK